MAVRRVVRGFRKGTARKTDWSASAVQSAATNIPASSAVLVESFTPVGQGETIVRTRGALFFFSDQSTADEDIIAAFGIGVVTAQAVSVGITAIPHPGTDAAWDGWLYHTYLHSHFEFGSTVGFEFSAGQRIDIDSKAMRKVTSDEIVVVVAEAMSAVGFQLMNSERFLTKPF